MNPEEITILSIINSNASAFFSIVSVLCGSLLTFWFTNVINKEERKWRINETSIKRKEDVHRELYGYCAKLSIFYNYTRYGEIRRTSVMFRTNKEYVEWCSGFIKFTSENEIMFSEEVIRILNLFSDYRNKLHLLMGNKINNIDNIEKRNLAYNYLGEFLLPDFATFSQELKQAARTYFNQDTSKKIIEDEKAFQPLRQEEKDTYLKKYLLYNSTPNLEKFINQAIS